MGSVLSRVAATERRQQPLSPSFECSVCLEVLPRPMRTPCRHMYSCPYCQCEVDEEELMDYCLSYHRSERRAVCCPICCLTPERDPSCFSSNFIRHLQFRHTLHCQDYIDINTVGEVLVEGVLAGSFLEYVHVIHPNSA